MKSSLLFFILLNTSLVFAQKHKGVNNLADSVKELITEHFSELEVEDKKIIRKSLRKIIRVFDDYGYSLPQGEEITLKCLSTGASYYIPTNISNGVTYGNSIYSLDKCNDAINTQVEGVFCASSGTNYYVPTNINSGKTYGKGIYLLDNCKEAIKPQVGGIICAASGTNYYVPTNINSGKTYGQGIYLLENCHAVLDTYNDGLMCVSTATNYYTPMNIETGLKLGNSVYGLDSCNSIIN